ncbi:PTPDL family protein [Brevifollis gellanilyticus]|uniref:Gram-positive cocci surface proteins LPxTG domain-containing protein n=1 Tax=Brevifollis gellanilyticus TaxID=748831 RepID=A0A512MAL4_9BACT|nr:PTPDL family protein [Brevifollis gellanilyticus]GEP43768.1 hypothetical protein BGE01nite_30590 [Brevifollis gellanilyticus]
MKISRFRTAVLALLCGTPLLHADILMLKNGTKVEGTILEQNDQGVKMRYRLTPKIMDEKIFPMADIDKVVKQTPQEVEVIELRKLLPTPNLLKADAYEQIIQDRLRPFVNKYPGTPEAQEVEAMIAKFQEEKSMVSNGQLKHEGRWLSPKEYKAEQWNIEAYLILASLREKTAKQDYVGALREFDRMMMPAPAYKGSTYFVQAIPEAITALEKWITSLDKMSAEQAQLDQARKEGLKKLQEPELSKTKNAISDEYNKWRAAYDAERRQKLRWTAPYKYDLPSIQTAQKEAVQELTRLQTLNMEELRTNNEIFTACYRKIGEGDYLGGAAAFERAQALNLQVEYRDIPMDLRARLLKLHAQLSRAAATGAATSGSTAMGGVAATGQDSRVAQILAEAGAAPAAAATGQPAAAATAPAATTTTTTTTTAPAAAVVQQPVQRPVAPVAQQPVPQAPVPPMPLPAPVPVVEESNTSLYIMIGMGVVIVGLLLAFLKKK